MSVLVKKVEKGRGSCTYIVSARVFGFSRRRQGQQGRALDACLKECSASRASKDSYSTLGLAWLLGYSFGLHKNILLKYHYWLSVFQTGFPAFTLQGKDPTKSPNGQVSGFSLWVFQILSNRLLIVLPLGLLAELKGSDSGLCHWMSASHCGHVDPRVLRCQRTMHIRRRRTAMLRAQGRPAGSPIIRLRLGKSAMVPLRHLPLVAVRAHLWPPVQLRC